MSALRVIRHYSPRARHEFALLGLLLSAFAIGIALLASALPLRESASPDRIAPGITLSGWRATTVGTGSVWLAQSTPRISYVPGGPGSFDIDLSVSGTGGYGDSQPVRVMVAGSPVSLIGVSNAVEVVRVRYTLPPAAWTQAQSQPITIDFETSQQGGIPPLALYDVSIRPTSVRSLLPLQLFLPILLLLLLYITCRQLFNLIAGLALSLLALILTLLAISTLAWPQTLLTLLYQPHLHPKRTIAIMVLILIALAIVPYTQLLSRGYVSSPRIVNRPPSPQSLHSRDLVLVFVVALAFRLLWVTLVPPWQAPDEGAHFSYVAHIVENRELPHAPPYTHNYPDYSPEFGQSWNNTLFARISTVGGASNPDLAFFPIVYDYQSVRDYQAIHADRLNQAGGTATTYPPLYYLIGAVGYRLFEDGSILSRLFASRSLSALLGAVSCVFAYLVGFETRRDRHWGMALGLSMALLPMYTFISSSINNDAAMVCATTALIWFAMRALNQQTISRALVWATGVTGGCLLLIKPTGYPVLVIVGLLFLYRLFPVRYRPWQIVWPQIKALSVLLLCTAGMYGSWLLIRLGTSPRATGTSSTAGLAGVSLSLNAQHSLLAYVQAEQNAGWPYFMWLFIKTFWGVFGWLEVYMPDAVYTCVVVFYAVGISGLIGRLVFQRHQRQQYLFLLALLVAQLVFMFIVIDYFLSFSQTGVGLGLQGRYFYPVLAPILLLLLSGWDFLFRERRICLYLAPAAICITQVVSLTTIISRYYGVTFG